MMFRKDYRSQVSVKGRVVCGYAAIFNNIDYSKEMIKPGAFSRTIADNGPEGTNRIVFLLQHRKEYVLGKPLILREDNIGLYHESFITETSYGNDALINIKAGVLDGLSIGYEVVKQQSKQKYKELIELRLSEFSAVTFPANEEARVTDLKEELFNAVDYGEQETAASLLEVFEKSYPGEISTDQQFAIELQKMINARFTDENTLEGLLKNLITK